MLTKVRKSVGARWVVEAPRIDMKSSGGFLSLCVLDEQTLELIGQFDIPVVTLIAWAFSQGVSHLQKSIHSNAISEDILFYG